MVVSLVDFKHFESQTATNGATYRERDERVREERERILCPECPYKTSKLLDLVD